MIASRSCKTRGRDFSLQRNCGVPLPRAGRRHKPPSGSNSRPALLFMAKIPLTREGFFATVDDADYERVIAAGPWHLLTSAHIGLTVYAYRNSRKPDGSQTSQRLHRFILGLTDPKVFVDHINGRGLDSAEPISALVQVRRTLRTDERKLQRGKPQARFAECIGIRTEESGTRRSRLTTSASILAFSRMRWTRPEHTIPRRGNTSESLHVQILSNRKGYPIMAMPVWTL